MDLCGCITCTDDRWKTAQLAGTVVRDLWELPVRFACEICGNKRCPHHTDHELACTNSNASGQPGSIYE